MLLATWTLPPGILREAPNLPKSKRKGQKERGNLKKIIFVACGLAILLSNGLLFAGDFAVYGDSQSDENAQSRVVQAILKFKPALIFRLGDIVDDGNDPEQWKAFNRIAAPLLTTTEYYPVLGNHEKDSELYFQNFPHLHHQRWYSVEREGIHFIVLDSNSGLREGTEQYLWLKSDLSRVREGTKFKIVFFHHPLFNVGFHDEDEKGLRPVLLPLFEKYGVCAVFSGHEHDYERFEYQGINFIVSGGGGSPLRGQDRDSPYLKKIVKTYHFCLISPGDDFLTVKVIDTESNVIDYFTVPAMALSEMKER